MVRLAQAIVGHALFQPFIIGLIVLAGVLAGLETNAALMARHGATLRLLDGMVLGGFVVEIVLRLAAHGRRPQAYFADGWNVFDCVIVLLCLLPAGGAFASVLRLARILRLLRLVHALPRLQLLVGALLKSLSAMGYVSLLLGLLFYIYAVAGVHLFAEATQGDFGNLSTAMLSLFRVVTLDNWGDIFNRALAGAPALVVTLYFVTFIVFGTMIILNLFIGIIMNSMAEMHAEMEKKAQPTDPSAARSLDETLADVQRRIEAVRAQILGGPGSSR